MIIYSSSDLDLCNNSNHNNIKASQSKVILFEIKYNLTS